MPTDAFVGIVLIYFLVKLKFVAAAAGHGKNSLQLFTKHYCGYKDSISVQLEGLSEAVFVAAAAGHGRGLVLAHQGRRVVRRRGRLEVSPET